MNDTAANLALLTPDELNVALFLTTALCVGVQPTPYFVAKRVHLGIKETLLALRRLAALGFIELPGKGYLHMRLTNWTHRLCPCCRQPMRVYAVNADKPDVLSAECRNPTCPELYMVTLPLFEHEKLTPKQREGYARSNARFRAQQAHETAR